MPSGSGIEELLVNAGAAGLVIIGIAMVLRLVLDFLIKYKGQEPKPKPEAHETLLKQVESLHRNLAQCSRETTDLWQWHQRETTNGVKAWYVPADMMPLIRQMSEEVKYLATKLDYHERVEMDIIGQILSKVDVNFGKIKSLMEEIQDYEKENVRVYKVIMRKLEIE